MKRILFLFTVILTSVNLYSQVGINLDGSNPDPSAGLDVKFNNKGLLPPRLTHAELISIISPASGLIVYCTDCGLTGQGAMAVYMSGSWNLLTSSCMKPGTPPVGTHVPGPTQIVWNWNIVGDAVGYKWGISSNYVAAIDVGSNTSYTETGLNCGITYTRYVWAYNSCGPSSSNTMTQSTSGETLIAPVEGVHIPSLNQIVWRWSAVADAIGYRWNTVNNYESSTDLGNVLQVIESGLTCNTFYTRFLWAYNDCGHSINTVLTDSTLGSSLTAPIAGTHISTSNQIIWNWFSVPGATGYKWNTIDDYGSATNLGTNTSKTETGLTCNTNYTRFVWAYDNCGHSNTTALNKSTLECGICGPSIIDERDGKTYNIVLIGTQCWFSQNLNYGSKIPGSQDQTNNGIPEKYCYANLESNCDVYGGLYQWNEMMQYVISPGTQGMCPNGWHIPTDAEWTNLSNFLGGDGVAGGKMKEAGIAHWPSPNTGATNSSGFTGLPDGYRNASGDFVWLPQYAYLRSSSEDGSGGTWDRNLGYNYPDLGRYNGYSKSNGNAVRCIKNSGMPN